MSRKLTTREFIDRAIKTHGDKYDYSETVYSDMNTEVTVRCPKHGYFTQRAGDHVHGYGCQKCGQRNTKSTTEEFVNRSRLIHGDKFDYSRVEYKGNKVKVCLICPVHGEFWITPNHHLRGVGCGKCGKAVFSSSRITSREDYIVQCRKAHGDTYAYDLVEYKTTKHKVNIVCREHGVFSQMAESHKNGHGCPKCSCAGTSKGQMDLILFLSKSTEVIEEFVLPGSKMRLDAFLPAMNIGVEYHGLRWHSTAICKHNPTKDFEKHLLAESLGIRIIHIYEDEWRYNRSVVENILLSAMGLLPRIHARKTKVVVVPDHEARQFLDAHHIQGGRKNTISLGLIFDDDLVAVMGFDMLRSVRTNTDYGHWELTRYAAKYCIVGGPSKLLKRFVSMKLCHTLTSYADRRMFTGSMYEKIGFTRVHETRPDYHYTTGYIEDRRIHKSRMQKKNLAKIFPSADMTKTEVEICRENRLYQIFDCGKIRFDMKM